MPAIMTHHSNVQPIPRLELKTSIVFSGEIETEVDCPTLIVETVQDEVVGIVEACDEIETTVEQDEIEVEIEEDEI